MRPTAVPWRFPAPAPHDGFPLGNGLFGALIWGSGNTLRLTINRQDFWNRDNRIVWEPTATYAEVRRQLASGKPIDTSRFNRRLKPDRPRPTRLAMGRFDLELTESLVPGELDVASGEARVGSVRAIVDRKHPILHLIGPVKSVRPVPNESEEVRKYRQEAHLPDPVPYAEGDVSGWVQELPGQYAMATACVVRPNGVALTSVYGTTGAEAKGLAIQMVHEAEPYEVVARRVEAWYEAFWNRVARVQIEHRPTEILHDLGMFKLSGAGDPNAPAITLQGPWVEDDRMPPWSCDYHFNINVQMCYEPCLTGNLPEWFDPLGKLLTSFRPEMTELARIHLGIDDGMMLPHSTDDRGTSIGEGFGDPLDAGSLPWVALQFYHLYRTYGDLDMLRNVAYPLMRGAMRVYETQVEREGVGWTLPMGASPEFHTAKGPAWGQDPSFQLAIIHALVGALTHSSKVLKLDEPRLANWQEIARGLPRCSVVNRAISVWRDRALDEPHRHHSHLSGIWPFEIIDPAREESLIYHTLVQWMEKGTGTWTGWCTVWAATLFAHLGQPVGAGQMLESYRKFFTGPVNYASRHNPQTHGFSGWLWGQEIMQLDAACGAVTAIHHMLAHTHGDRLALAPAVPAEWGDVSFSGLRLPGGKVASGSRVGGEWHKLKAE